MNLEGSDQSKADVFTQATNPHRKVLQSIPDKASLEILEIDVCSLPVCTSYELVVARSKIQELLGSYSVAVW